MKVFLRQCMILNIHDSLGLSFFTMHIKYLISLLPVHRDDSPRPDFLINLQWLSWIQMEVCSLLLPLLFITRERDEALSYWFIPLKRRQWKWAIKIQNGQLITCLDHYYHTGIVCIRWRSEPLRVSKRTRPRRRSSRKRAKLCWSTALDSTNLVTRGAQNTQAALCTDSTAALLR